MALYLAQRNNSINLGLTGTSQNAQSKTREGIEKSFEEIKLKLFGLFSDCTLEFSLSESRERVFSSSFNSVHQFIFAVNARPTYTRMKSNVNNSQNSVPLLRESSFNPYGSYMLSDDKFGYDQLPSIEQVVPRDISNPQSQQQPQQQQPQHLQQQMQEPGNSYNEADTLFAYLAHTEDSHELPELEFPVPAPDVIPDMVFENDNNEDKPILFSTERVYTVPELSTSTASSSHSSPTASNINVQGTSLTIDTHKNEIKQSTIVEVDDSRIPIQSSYVAYARAGVPSVAAVQDRRARNTQSARRSRARRVDKLAVLREENAVLMLRNEELSRENAELKRIIESYSENEAQIGGNPRNTIRQRSPMPRGIVEMKPEIPRSPYESF